jgi:beta-N-acetylhexosaminidase
MVEMLGPVMLDIQGLLPTPQEAELITHPWVGGVILFTRNYENLEQLRELTRRLLALKPDLIIAVDHEGGRVQRFRQGFSALPPMRSLGELYDRDTEAALEAAQAMGFVLAWELVREGVNLSFTPVLDLDYGQSTVIGNRAFHRNPEIVAALCGRFMAGLHQAGVPAVGKHFPGHGYVAADSHLALPVDERNADTIAAADLVPYEKLIPLGLDAVMPAHVVYSSVDAQPAGFSPHWLKTVLRQRYAFEGVIFSDDLSMEGAVASGPPVERARLALQAGCDMVLVCNHPAAAREIIDGLNPQWWETESRKRIRRMMGHSRPSIEAGNQQLESALSTLGRCFPNWMKLAGV